MLTFLIVLNWAGFDNELFILANKITLLLLIVSGVIIFGAIQFRKFTDYIPIIGILAWLSGVMSGIYRDNDLAIVFSHYSGISSILLYYIFKKISWDNCYYFLAKLAVLSLALFTIKLIVISGVKFDTRVFYFHEFIWLFAAFGIFVGKKAKFGELKNWLFYLLIFFMNMMVASKSFWLLLAAIFSVVNISKIKNKLFFYPIVFAGFAIVSQLSYMYLFSFDVSGNDKRLGYILFYIENFSLWPAGIGSPVFSIDIIGNNDFLIFSKSHQSYSEVAFLDFPFKCGFLGYLFILMIVSYALWCSIKLFFHRKDRAHLTSVILLLSYLISSLGNPTLFSIDSVLVLILGLTINEKRTTI